MWKDFCLISFVKLSDRLDSSCRLTWLRNVSFLSPLLSSPSCFKIKFMFSKIQLYYNVFYDVHELSHTKSNNHKNITYMLKMWMIWPNHELLKTNKIMVYNGKSNAANLGLDKTKQIPQKPRVISHAREVRREVLIVKVIWDNRDYIGNMSETVETVTFRMDQQLMRALIIDSLQNTWNYILDLPRFNGRQISNHSICSNHTIYTLVYRWLELVTWIHLGTWCI